jgi:hypothetical protein
MFDKCLAQRFSNNYCNNVNYCSLSGFAVSYNLSQMSYVPYGPQMVQLNSRNLFDEWGGSVSLEMSFSYATMMAGVDNWNS